MIRGAVVLPNGTGKTVRVAVFAKGVKMDEAKAAGADIVGNDDLADDIQAGKINFDVLIATPDCMGIVGKVGRILGPKGLMPNPKTGTVTMDVTKAVNDAKGGQVTYRVDKKVICKQLLEKFHSLQKLLKRMLKHLSGLSIKQNLQLQKEDILLMQQLA